jgi:serine/threonine protein kinase
VKICPVCSREYADEVRFCADDGTTLRAATPAASLVGQVIADRYHVVKKLGEGGMGQVYLAEHVKMGRRSAIKVMSPTMVHDPDSIARFNREAQNASRITHPNVCAVYDFGETAEGLIYLAMEFVDGKSLTDVLEQEGALPLPRATAIFKQTADALQAAHDLGIVHRDLKPDNIMLTTGRDGADIVKVVDFGIAKAFAGDEAAQKVTKTGFVTGTPEFMSPEQLSGDKVDGRSDLYSLALVYFRMLTGQLPFQAETVQEVMIKRLTDEPATLAQARPDLTFPDGLQAVLNTAMARMPKDRYQSVAKFGAWRRRRGRTWSRRRSSWTPTRRAPARPRARPGRSVRSCRWRSARWWCWGSEAGHGRCSGAGRPRGDPPRIRPRARPSTPRTGKRTHRRSRSRRRRPTPPGVRGRPPTAPERGPGAAIRSRPWSTG